MSTPIQTVQQCGIVILAAGTSRRLGQPKQLLIYNGKNLLQHAVDTASESLVKNIVVVLGSEYEKIQHELNKRSAEFIYNADWQEGMASSIRVGISNTLEIFPDTDCIIFMVCDQPFVNKDLLNDLLKSHRHNGKLIAASRYGEILGTPALFHSSIFPELMELKGDTGARKILTNHKNDVSIVIFEEGKTDIDTIADYENLLKAK